MAKTLQDLPVHPVRSLLPALGRMESLGFDRQACLKSTGILLSQLDDPKARMSLQQELAFYRNTLELSGDRLIGLKLGERFIPQRYGLFGYALLSAATFRHALTLIENFGSLTFSFYTFSYGVSGKQSWLSLSEPPPFEQELVDLYLDRDMSAAVVDFREILGEPLPIEKIYVSHDGHGRHQDYKDYYGCDVHFCAQSNKIVSSSSFLDKALPQSDPESSRHFQQQCQLLIGKLTSQSHFVDDVRMLMLARPGYFPDIDYLAEKLSVSIRTLRRRLREEGSCYREMLDEIRYGLATEYLSQTQLSVVEVSGLLGYTEAGNFSHAFRRWSGVSPRQWRSQQNS